MNIASLYQRYKESGKISTDTRQIVPGSIFFSLKGPHFNANTLAREALDKGASYAVVDEERWVEDNRYIMVKDSLHALQQLARHHRNQLHIPIIALTGSNGKTTTKELLFAVLSKKYNTLATKGNLNNHIGVPLTLLAIDAKTEIAVIEMGANHVGEIATLCRIANPTHGSITNIGNAHIGTFGGMENIVCAKEELYQYLTDTGGSIWVNSKNAILYNLSKRLKNPMFYPAQGDYFYCKFVAADPFVRIKTKSGKAAQTHLLGAYNFENIALALCIANFFHVDEADAIQAIEGYKPSDMRSQVVIQGTNTIILDAYNANPTSMEAAISNLSQMKAKRRIAILGDMYELGADSDKEHLKVIALLKKRKVDEAYLCGSAFFNIGMPESTIHFFPSPTALEAHLKQQSIHHSTVLIKASRGMALENMLRFI